MKLCVKFEYEEIYENITHITPSCDGEELIFFTKDGLISMPKHRIKDIDFIEDYNNGESHD